MKPNFKMTLLSVTAISLTGSLVFAATQQDPASLAYVNAQDIDVEKTIAAKGGSVSPSSSTCRIPDYGAGTPASIAYVNNCDLELYEAIETIPIGSPFSVGDTLCGNTHPYTCPASGAQPWGIVIYADPNPTTSGFYGVAMSVADITTGLPSGTPSVVWASGNAQNTEINADNYGIYGGINSTYKNYKGESVPGNTKIFCDLDTGSDCKASDYPYNPSTFNACLTYSAGPTLAGGWYLPAIAEVEAMFTYAQTQPLPGDTNVGTFNSYWYWSSEEWNGADNAASFTTPDRTHGNLGYDSDTALPPDPANQAFYFGFVDGTQDHTSKSDTNKGVRCVQALPVV
jgi:hypothetical protein